MNKEARRQEWRALNRRLRKHGKDGKIKMKIDVLPFPVAMLDWRYGKGACEYLSQAFEGAKAASKDGLTCFCCCKDWTMKRSPIGCLTVEYLGLPPINDEDCGLLAGICWDCMDNGYDEIMRAVKRDFPHMSDVYQMTSDPGHA